MMPRGVFEWERTVIDQCQARNGDLTGYTESGVLRLGFLGLGFGLWACKACRCCDYCVVSCISNQRLSITDSARSGDVVADSQTGIRLSPKSLSASAAVHHFSSSALAVSFRR